jgi:hypothetical protein
MNGFPDKASHVPDAKPGLPTAVSDLIAWVEGVAQAVTDEGK